MEKVAGDTGQQITFGHDPQCVREAIDNRHHAAVAAVQAEPTVDDAHVLTRNASIDMARLSSCPRRMTQT